MQDYKQKKSLKENSIFEFVPTEVILWDIATPVRSQIHSLLAAQPEKGSNVCVPLTAVTVQEVGRKEKGERQRGREMQKEWDEGGNKN